MMVEVVRIVGHGERTGRPPGWAQGGRGRVRVRVRVWMWCARENGHCAHAIGRDGRGVAPSSRTLSHPVDTPTAGRRRAGWTGRRRLLCSAGSTGSSADTDAVVGRRTPRNDDPIGAPVTGRTRGPDVRLVGGPPSADDTDRTAHTADRDAMYGPGDAARPIPHWTARCGAAACPCPTNRADRLRVRQRVGQRAPSSPLVDGHADWRWTGVADGRGVGPHRSVGRSIERRTRNRASRPSTQRAAASPHDDPAPARARARWRRPVLRTRPACCCPPGP